MKLISISYDNDKNIKGLIQDKELYFYKDRVTQLIVYDEKNNLFLKGTYEEIVNGNKYNDIDDRIRPLLSILVSKSIISRPISFLI